MTTPVPSLVVITDRHAARRAGRRVRDTVAGALEGGAPAVLLRDKDLAPDDRRALGQDLQRLVDAAGAQLLVASDEGLARDLGADGVHLGAADVSCPGTGLLVGRSCHDAGEVAAARAEGASYAFVAPVARTPSKPGYGPPLGPAGVRALVAAAGHLPLLALGGVTPDDVATWRSTGVHGVAVMGGVMGARDPVATVRALLTAWATGPGGVAPPHDARPTATTGEVP